MKILHVINALKPTGAELVSLNTLASLQKNNRVEIHLVAVRQNLDLDQKEIFFQTIGKENITDLNIPTVRSPSNFISAIMKLQQVIDLYKPSIVHSHCEIPDLLCAILRRTHRNKIFIRTSHNEKYWSSSRFSHQIERLMATNFDVNVCISEETLSAHHHVRTCLIHNAIRIGARMEKANPSSSQKIRVGIIGRFTDQKNQLNLMKAIREKDTDLKGKVDFHFFGSGELLSKAKLFSRHIETKAIFHGFVNNIDDIYSGLDCIVIPSKYEGLSSVMIEAITRGIPVYSLPVSGTKDVRRLLNYTIECPTLGCLLDKVTQPLPSISPSEINRVLECFDPNRSASKHFDLYTRLVEHTYDF